MKDKYPKEKQKMIEEHKRRMYNMRFFGLDWQEIHQKRWDGDDCTNDTCDCEEIKKSKEPEFLYSEDGDIVMAYVYDEELKEKRMVNRKELDKLRNES